MQKCKHTHAGNRTRIEGVKIPYANRYTTWVWNCDEKRARINPYRVVCAYTENKKKSMTEEVVDAFKATYVGHVKKLVMDPVLDKIRGENYGAFIDRVTDVFEYMIVHFEESQRIWTPNFREVAHTTAYGNLQECRKMCVLRNKSPEVLERIAYLCLVLERFLSLM